MKRDEEKKKKHQNTPQVILTYRKQICGFSLRINTLDYIQLCHNQEQ